MQSHRIRAADGHRQFGHGFGLVVAIAIAIAVVVPAGSAYAATPVSESISIPTSGSFLYMNSEPGDYIGGGIEQLYTSADSSISGSLSPDENSFSASAIQGPYTHWWYVYMAAPAGDQLAEGAYESAVRWPFQPAGTPGLSIFGDGRGCNTLTGRFVVNEILRAPAGELLVFDADFEQHCEGGAPALFGRIRIENPPPPPDVTPPTLVLPSDITVEAPDSQGTYVGYSAWATDDRDASPDFACVPASGSFFAVGTTTVECTATDDSGNLAAGSFRIAVLPYLELGLALNAVGSVDPKIGVAVLSGTLTCSRSIDVTVTGTVQQVFARRVVISGYFSALVSCVGPSTPFSVTVSGSNGLFVPGAAMATMDANGCELSCHFASVSSTKVNLRGR